MTSPNSNISSKKTVILNTLFLYLRMFVTIAVGLYASRVVLNVLGKSDFGVFSLVGGIVLTLNFLNAGMLQASQRFLSWALGKGDDDELCRTFWASWYAHVMIAIIVVIIGETVGLYVVNQILNIPADRMVAANWVYQCSVFTFAVSVLSVPYNSAIIAHEKMNFFAYVSILEAVLKLVIVYLLLVLAYDKLITYAVLMLSVQTLIRFIYSVYCHRKFSESNSKRVCDTKLIKSMLSFAGWSFLGNLGITSREQGTSVILNLFFGTIVNAARGIAVNVSSMISTFATNITMALNPPIIKSYAAGNIEESSSLVYMGCRASFYMLTLLVIPFFMNINYILALWLVNVPENTDLFLYFILAVSLIYAMSQPVTGAIQATGHVKWFQIWIFSLMMTELVLTGIVLYLTHNLLYSLFPSVVVNFAAAMMRLGILKRLTGYYSFRDYLLKVVARCFMVFLVAYLLAEGIHILIHTPGFLYFLLESAVHVLVVGGIIFGLGLNRSEQKLITSKVKRVIAKRL